MVSLPVVEAKRTPDDEMTRLGRLPFHCESEAVVVAPPEELFAFLDNPKRMASHMSESSWMMGGARMSIELDERLGQDVGSKIRLAGRVLGVELSVDEAVTERTIPRFKAWETSDEPRLLVIGHYRMGFAITARAAGSLLRVFIDYALPKTLLGRWLGLLLGRFYARWCTRQMAQDAARHFTR